MQARCEELPATHIAESWQLRPDMPKHLDWLYEQIAQGSAVEDREDLLAQLNTAPRPEPLVAPPNARGLLLLPQSIERLDLNQTDGVHERQRYTLHADQWAVETLIP